MYKINVTNAVINSVIQKLCHTPVEPINRFKIKAKPSITKIYRNIEIIKEENPLPKASRLPDTVIDTEEIIKPILIILKAVSPIEIVSGLAVNKPINFSGINKQRTVPSAITVNIIERAVLNIFLTLVYSSAP